MKNVLIGGAVILVVLIGGFFALNSYIYNEKQADVERAVIAGTVSAIDLTPMAADGPARITIRTENGEEKIVEVPARINLCPAMPNIVDVGVLEVGDAAEVTGDVGAEGVVVPCESMEHYFRAKGAYTNPALGFKFIYQKDRYVMTSPPHGNEEEADFEEAFVLTLKTDYNDMMAATEPREGPPTISVLVYRNTKKQSALQWAEANDSVSNIEMKIGEVKDAVIGGANAIRYAVDGLYPTDTVVVPHGSYVYVLVGSYLDEEYATRKDFEPLMRSVRFIPAPGQE